MYIYCKKYIISKLFFAIGNIANDSIKIIIYEKDCLLFWCIRCTCFERKHALVLPEQGLVRRWLRHEGSHTEVCQRLRAEVWYGWPQPELGFLLSLRGHHPDDSWRKWLQRRKDYIRTWFLGLHEPKTGKAKSTVCRRHCKSEGLESLHLGWVVSRFCSWKRQKEYVLPHGSYCKQRAK